MDPISIASTPALQHEQLRSAEPAATLPPAPPELVRQFEALMAHGPVQEIGSVADSPLLKSAVARVDAHLQHHAEVIDRVMATRTGDMSLAETQAVAAQNMVQLGMLSMNQAAYFEVLGSTKSTVSALMKNQ